MRSCLFRFILQVDESISEGDISFMETVAAIVIQTAIRRMLAIRVLEKMLQDITATEDAPHLGALPRQCFVTFPPESAQPFEPFFESDDAQHLKPSPSSDGKQHTMPVPSENAQHRCELETVPSEIERKLGAASTEDEMNLEPVPCHMYDVATILIQSTFRGWWVRDSLNVDHFCACRIQRAYRAYRARMIFIFDIYRTVVIQSLWRRKLALRKAETLRIAREKSVMFDIYRAVIIQSLWRQKLAKKEVENLRMEKMDRERSFMFDVYRAVIVQSLWRRKLALRKAEQLRNEGRTRDVFLTGSWLFDQDLIRTVQNDAAVTIQSQWRVYVAQREYLDCLVSVILLQSVARKWLAKQRVSSISIDNVFSDEAPEDHHGSQNQLGITAAQGENGGLTEEVVLNDAQEEQAAIPSDIHRQCPDQVHRSTSTEFKLIEDRDEQQWVKVSDSYDEETLVQSVALSLNSNARTEVSKLSADEVIELFIHMSMNKDAGRVTPLRMESPVSGSMQEVPAAVNVQRRSRPASVNSNSAVCGEGKVKVDPNSGRPPRKEKKEESNVKHEDTMTREMVQEVNEVDRANAKMSGSASNFWKSKDRGNASKALQKRRGVKPLEKEKKAPGWFS